MVSLDARPVVAVFDFDGTITTKDTFFPFLLLAFGKLRVCHALARLALEGMLVMLRLSSRDRYKERLVRILFSGEAVSKMTEIGVQHAKNIRSFVRPAAQKRITWHKERGHRLVLVSASLELYLEPIVELLQFDELLCTKLSKKSGVFDGALDGENCRAGQKVARMKDLLGDLSLFNIHGYGDSSGDKEMLEASDHPHWQPFAPGGKFCVS